MKMELVVEDEINIEKGRGGGESGGGGRRR